MTTTLNDQILGHWASSAAPAVVGTGLAWSGEELCDRAFALGEWLDEIGVPDGAAVPALLDESAGAVALAVGAALSGRAQAPLGTRLPVDQLAAAVRNLGTPVVVTEPARVEVAAEVAERAGVQVAVLPSDRRHPKDRRVRGGPDDVAAVIHTSGTTGQPKPVFMRHGQLAARNHIYAQAVELEPGDSYCTASPWYHLAGMGMALLSLGAGAATVPCPGYTLAEWQRVRALRPTHVLLVPTVIDLLLAAGEFGVGPRVLHYGAAPIHPSTLREAMDALPSTRLVQIFGQTEVSPICSLRPEDHVRAARGDTHLLESVGRPRPDVELRVEAPDGDGVGELAVRAPHTFVVDPDGWRRTGDLGVVDGEGFVYLRGRRGDMIVRGGENIYPLEIELVLGAHPAVAEVCVVGVPDRRWGEIVKAVVVPAGPGEVSPAELQSWVRDRLAHFKVPAVVELTGELPKTPTGKVLRRALRGA